MTSTVSIPITPRSERERQTKWDNRFIVLARHIATWSRDPSTKVGSVIVRPDHTIASLGYNGFPRGVSDDPEIYENRPEKYQRVVHAEMNAILACGERLKGYTLYVWPLPTCDRCAAHIIQTGISRVVWLKDAAEDEATKRWSETEMRAMDMYAQAGVQVSIIDGPST